MEGEVKPYIDRTLQRMSVGSFSFGITEDNRG